MPSRNGIVKMLIRDDDLFVHPLCMRRCKGLALGVANLTSISQEVVVDFMIVDHKVLGHMVAKRVGSMRAQDFAIFSLENVLFVA